MVGSHLSTGDTEMAQVHGKAGDATYRSGDRLMVQALVSMLLMGILTYFLFYWGGMASHLLRLGMGIAVIGLGFWCIRGILRLETAADRYYAGAGGEYDVGTILSGLSPEFHVLNGVGFYGGDIDHIIVGPTGIFVVETKNHGGTVSLKHGRLCRNGKPLDRDYLRQVRLETRYVKERLDVQAVPAVQPVLVFARAKVRVAKSVHGVRICALASLCSLITSPSPFMSADEAKRLSALFEIDNSGGFPSSRLHRQQGLRLHGDVPMAGLVRPGFINLQWPWH